MLKVFFTASAICPCDFYRVRWRTFSLISFFFRSIRGTKHITVSGIPSE